MKKTIAAFTLVEVMTALGLLSLVTVGSVAALLQANNNANLSRLKTGAGTVAQNQIDLFLSLQPYNPQKFQEPLELTTGSHCTGSSTVPTVPIYTDPATNTVVTWGWITNEVLDTNQNLNGVNYNLRRLNCTVNYRYRNILHTVSMSTMRASDI
jgi:type II secretory pathway pseudopilin PulG